MTIERATTAGAIRVASADLERWGTATFEACGVAPAEAALAAAVLVRTNRRGIDTHGVSRIPAYVQKLRSSEVKGRPNIASEVLKLGTKPYAEDRPPTLIIDQHDNNTGDAGLTLTYKYSDQGGESDTDDVELNKLIHQGAEASGAERTKLFQQAFARIEQDIVPDVMLFHMVGYRRVGPRLIFHPTIATNSERQLAEIAFK